MTMFVRYLSSSGREHFVVVSTFRKPESNVHEYEITMSQYRTIILIWYHLSCISHTKQSG